MRIDAGHLDRLPVDRCVSIGDGSAVVVRTADGVVAFANRCLHQDSPLGGGWVRDDVLSCPLHFWRYRVDDGSLIGGGVDDVLERFPVSIADGEVCVDVPDPPPRTSLREQLLARARTYDRAGAYARRVAEPPTTAPDPLTPETGTR